LAPFLQLKDDDISIMRVLVEMFDPVEQAIGHAIDLPKMA
jgi:hypothetical protein